ncbi:MAG: NupC/NupG family nucleoside CNT transporter, partial [Deltaproteobacteria bacterium]|nr:NupC/NupG family nucleoside CNT transporter [Deltaproteobacteria bacterium]
MGILGIVVLLGLAFLLSNNKRNINWHTVGVGLALQVGIGFLLIKWEAGNQGMQWFAGKAASFLGLASHGTRFLFGNLVDPAMMGTFGFQFAFTVLPVIIFFSAFTSFLYYIGVLQKVVQGVAWVMSRLMRTSGAESLSCSGNIFLGQTESPLLIRPFLNHLTMSELCAVMVGGFGTIAGSVMAGYILMGISAQHIIIASTMAAPASLMIAKIIFPETGHSETAGGVKLPAIDRGRNVLDAISRGTTDGLHLALNVAAMLVAFITLIACFDKILSWGDRWIDGAWLTGVLMKNGEYAGWFPGSLKTAFGTLLSPLALVMGVPAADVQNVGHLLGLKLSVNEFVAYSKLGPLMKEGLISEKGGIMATYILCGFANFASIGIQIGGISALAPERRSDLAKLG